MQDFVTALAWFIYITPEIFTEACKVFPRLKCKMGLEKFKEWAMLEHNQNSCFVNIVKLVIWFWLYREQKFIFIF